MNVMRRKNADFQRKLSQKVLIQNFVKISIINSSQAINELEILDSGRTATTINKIRASRREPASQSWILLFLNFLQLVMPFLFRLP